MFWQVNIYKVFFGSFDWFFQLNLSIESNLTHLPTKKVMWVSTLSKNFDSRRRNSNIKTLRRLQITFYIIAGINQYIAMRATTLEEAYVEAKAFAEAYGLYDLEFVDGKSKYSI